MQLADTLPHITYQCLQEPTQTKKRSKLPPTEHIQVRRMFKQNRPANKFPHLTPPKMAVRTEEACQKTLYQLACQHCGTSSSTCCPTHRSTEITSSWFQLQSQALPRSEWRTSSSQSSSLANASAERTEQPKTKKTEHTRNNESSVGREGTMWALVEWSCAKVHRRGHRILVVMHLVVQFRRGVAPSQ